LYRGVYVTQSMLYLVYLKALVPLKHASIAESGWELDRNKVVVRALCVRRPSKEVYIPSKLIDYCCQFLFLQDL